MLRKRPAAEAVTTVHSPLLAARGKGKKVIFFFTLNFLNFSALHDHGYLEHFNQRQQRQRQSCPDRRYRFIVRWLHWVHTGHILALHYPAGLDLYPMLLPNSPVWSSGSGEGWWGEGGGRHCPPRTSPHSFEEQPSLIINRHTKRWAPKQYGTDLFMGTSAGRFWATHRRSPLLFRYLHVSERRAGWEEGSGRGPQRICSTFPFSPFCKTGQF